MDKKMEAVVFDMDGVIFDSESKVIECWEVIADKYQIVGIKDACMQSLGINREATREKMAQIYGTEFPYDTYKAECSALFHERYGEGRLPLKEGAKELLAWLKQNGYKVALASSTRTEVVREELRDAGIIDYFDELVCGDMVSRSKPFPDIFLKACEMIGVSPDRAIGIEDSFNGIRACKRAGLYTIMVPDLKQPDEEILGLADIVLPNLDKVRELLET